jgi:putative ABC transport system ATP-binding protein
LDGGTERMVLELLRDRANDGCAVLIVTHSAEAVRIADRVIALDDGQIRDVDTPVDQLKEVRDVAG